MRYQKFLYANSTTSPITTSPLQPLLYPPYLFLPLVGARRGAFALGTTENGKYNDSGVEGTKYQVFSLGVKVEGVHHPSSSCGKIFFYHHLFSFWYRGRCLLRLQGCDDGLFVQVPGDDVSGNGGCGKVVSIGFGGFLYCFGWM